MNHNSVQYWNQPQTKADKPFDIDDSEDKKWLSYARLETNLETCFRDSVAYLPALQTTLRGQVLDVCAGVCWASAIVACEGIEETPSRTQILRDEFYAMRHSPREFLGYHSANGWTFAYAPVDESGRHRFTDVQYTRALKRAGFNVARQVLDYPVFPDSGVNAINNFGIKG
jgi:hypothetical protein